MTISDVLTLYLLTSISELNQMPHLHLIYSLNTNTDQKVSQDALPHSYLNADFALHYITLVPEM